MGCPPGGGRRRCCVRAEGQRWRGRGPLLRDELAVLRAALADLAPMEPQPAGFEFDEDLDLDHV